MKNSRAIEPETSKGKNETNEVNIQKQCLKHILFAMTLCGCYSNSYHDNSKLSCKGLLMRFYQLFVFMLLLFLIGKTVSGFSFISKEDYVGQSIALMWKVYCTINFLLSVKMQSTRFGSQTKTFELWNRQICPKMIECGIEFKEDRFIRKQIILCIMAAIIIAIVVLFTVLQLSGILGTGNSGMSTIPFERSSLTIILQAFLVMICTMQATTPTIFTIVICYLLCQCLRNFNKLLKAKLALESFDILREMQTLRQVHTSLCQAVQEFDKDLSYIFGNTFFWNMSNGLFTLYVLIQADISAYGTIGIITYTFWMTLCLGTLATMSIFAALVNEAAHAPLDTIYYINVQDITVEKLAQLNLFLSKLTGTQVGFSTCGLLIITKEFILTIAGVFLTYFTVLYTL